MEENSSRVSRKVGTHEVSRGGPARKSRYTTVDEEGEDLMECSGKYCQSCSAVLIADCVALCCCPCALVNILALAFGKVPWMMGRRCLGRGKRKKNKLEMKRKCKKNSAGEGDGVVVERDGNLRKGRTGEEILEIATGFGDQEEEMGRVSARFEAERVWLELYQVGHLGFGRVSYTGSQNDGVLSIREIN